jgi:FkbM family methyltransferase
MAALTGLRRVIAQSGSLTTATVLSGIYLYARLQGRGGQGMAVAGPPRAPDGAHWKSLRETIATAPPARHVMQFRMRDGSRMRCRIADGGGLLSVHVDRDYDIPGIDWPNVRTIVDIGAHVGGFTVWAALRAPAARCLAVEPNPETFSMLVRNIRDNGLSDRVTAVNAAVAGAPGTGSLELIEHSLGTRLARHGDGKVSVEVTTMRALMASAGMQQVDVLKIDCEGMEYEVFGSMDSADLARFRVVACEYHPEPGHDVVELDTLLRTAGFQVRRPEEPLGVLWATS